MPSDDDPSLLLNKTATMPKSILCNYCFRGFGNTSHVPRQFADFSFFFPRNLSIKTYRKSPILTQGQFVVEEWLYENFHIRFFHLIIYTIFPEFSSSITKQTFSAFKAVQGFCDPQKVDRNRTEMFKHERVPILQLLSSQYVNKNI